MIRVNVHRRGIFPHLDNAAAQSLCAIAGKPLPGSEKNYTTIARNGPYELDLLADAGTFFLCAPKIAEVRWPEVFGVTLVEHNAS